MTELAPAQCEEHLRRSIDLAGDSVCGQVGPSGFAVGPPGGRYSRLACANGRFLSDPGGGTRVEAGVYPCGLARWLFWATGVLFLVTFLLYPRVVRALAMDDDRLAALLFIVIAILESFALSVVGSHLNRVVPPRDQASLVSFLEQALRAESAGEAYEPR